MKKIIEKLKNFNLGIYSAFFSFLGTILMILDFKIHGTDFYPENLTLIGNIGICVFLFGLFFIPLVVIVHYMYKLFK